MTYKFRLPIGDWSNDGHGSYEEYIIKSNKSVEEVRELYFKTKVKTNASLDGSDWDKMRKNTPCSEYCDNSISENQIKQLGLNIKDYEIYLNDSIAEPEMFANLFVDFMLTHNKGLKLELIVTESLPMLPFFGYDERKRHIGYFGYGLFD